MKDLTRLVILGFFTIIWFVKPISYERLAYQQDVRHQHQKTANKVFEIPYSGGQESHSNNFIPPQYREYKSDTRLVEGSGQESSQGFSTNPRLGLGASGNNGSGGGGGSFDDNNVPPKSEWETNPDYWQNYKYNPNSLKKKNNEQCELEKKVEEKFDESNAVKKLVRVALKNQDVKNEYERIKKRLEEGLNPVDIGSKSTPVASNKVLIKGDVGRYLVEVSGGQVKVLGMCARGNAKNVNSFKTLMNEMYGVDLKY